MNYSTQSAEAGESIESLWPYLTIPRNLAYRSIGEEVFCWLLGPHIRERYSIVGGIGTNVFLAIEKRTPFARFIDDVTKHYKVETYELVDDLEQFLPSMVDAGILVDQRRDSKVGVSSSLEVLGAEQDASRDVLDLMFERASVAAHPLKVFLEMTNQCTHRCKHCYLGLGTDTKVTEADRQLLSTSRLSELLHELAEEGVLDLVLTGGEPTLHPNFAEILQRAVELRFAVTVLTNGSLLDENLVELLASVPLFQVRIPIYGLEEYHNRFVGNARSFERVWWGIQALQARGVNVVPTSILMDDNGEDLIELKGKLCALGLPFEVSPLIFPTVFQDGMPIKYRASDAQLRAMMPKLGIRLRRSRCNAGVSRFRITPDGDLKLCEMIPHSFGNLQDDSLKTILNSPSRQEWLAQFPLLVEAKENNCEGCSIQKYCVNCIGLSYLESSSFTRRSQESCRLAHITALVEKHSKASVKCQMGAFQISG